MKKIVLTLFLMFSVCTFANNTTNGNPKKEKNGVSKNEAAKKELDSIAVEKRNEQTTEEIKKVFCVIFVDNEPEIFEYSCFFCWGGAKNGCMAAGCKFYLVCFE
jgi:hypothetical protein